MAGNKVIHELPKTECYRTEGLVGYSDPTVFRWVVFTIEQCGNIPVVQVCGKETIVYAVKSGALRKEKVRESLERIESQ